MKKIHKNDKEGVFVMAIFNLILQEVSRLFRR